MMDRAELPVHRNKTLKCRGVTPPSNATPCSVPDTRGKTESGPPRPITSISPKHASSSFLLSFGIAFRLQPSIRNNLARLPAAIGSFSEKHHDAGMNLVPQSAKGVDAFFSCFRKSRRILEWPMKPFRTSRRTSGHSSLALSQTVITKSNVCPSNSRSGFDR